MYDLIIKNAKLVSNTFVDILIIQNQIVTVGENASLDQTSKKWLELDEETYVSAGWIDAHSHCYCHSPLYYDDADKAGVSLGVTMLIDAGSSGADAIDDFYESVKHLETQVKAFLNISRIGLVRQNELADMSHIDSELALNSIQRHPDFIIGLKARMSKSVVGNNYIKPLLEAKKIQDCCQLPLMVHVGNAPPQIDEIASLLTQGDIITHCYNGKPNKILDDEGNLRKSIQDALIRGVLLDVGHGSESFSFNIAEQAMNIGTYPHLISSDIYKKNREAGPVYSLAHVMTKFVALGLSLEQVINCVTENVSKHLHLKNKGVLKTGADADLTFFRLDHTPIELIDAEGSTRTAEYQIVPIGTIISGQIVNYCDS